MLHSEKDTVCACFVDDSLNEIFAGLHDGF